MSISYYYINFWPCHKSVFLESDANTEVAKTGKLEVGKRKLKVYKELAICEKLKEAIMEEW